MLALVAGELQGGLSPALFLLLDSRVRLEGQAELGLFRLEGLLGEVRRVGLLARLLRRHGRLGAQLQLLERYVVRIVVLQPFFRPRP